MSGMTAGAVFTTALIKNDWDDLLMGSNSSAVIVHP